jgi:hypothetical protein
MSLVGRWRIAAMELWAQEDVDLVGPGFIAFGRDHTGSLGFIAVEGGLGLVGGLSRRVPRCRVRSSGRSGTS